LGSVPPHWIQEYSIYNYDEADDRAKHLADVVLTKAEEGEFYYVPVIVESEEQEEKHLPGSHNQQDHAGKWPEFSLEQDLPHPEWGHFNPISENEWTAPSGASVRVEGEVIKYTNPVGGEQESRLTEGQKADLFVRVMFGISSDGELGMPLDWMIKSVVEATYNAGDES